MGNARFSDTVTDPYPSQLPPVSARTRRRDQRYRTLCFGAFSLGYVVVFLSADMPRGVLVPAIVAGFWPRVAARLARRFPELGATTVEALLAAFCVAPLPLNTALPLWTIALLAHLHRWGWRALPLDLASGAAGFALGRALLPELLLTAPWLPWVAELGLLMVLVLLALTSHNLARYLARARHKAARQARAQRELAARLRRYLPPPLYQQLLMKPRAQLRLQASWHVVLFVDWVGFTATTERLSAEELRFAVNGYLAAVDRAARRYGVTVAKFLGDGVLLTVPAAEGGAVRRAALRRGLAAGFCLLGALPRLRRLWQLRGIREAPALRVGVACGLCTVGDWGGRRLEYTVIGSPVNLASRLQGAASRNAVLLCGNSRRLLPAPCAGRERRLVVKGLGLVRAFELTQLPGAEPGCYGSGALEKD